MAKRTKNRVLKSSTALSTPSKEDVKLVDLKSQPPKVEPVAAGDPPVEVVNLPENLTAKVSDERASPKPGIGGENPEDVLSTVPTGFMFPWAQHAKLLEMAQTNTRFILRIAESFTRARSPQDLLALAAEFSKECEVLFREQSNAMLRIFAGQPAD